MSTKPMNKHQIARILDRTALTATDRELRSDAEALVAVIDSGAGGLPAKLDSFLSGAWSRTARGVAAGTKKAASLREILALETALGLAPVDDQETDTVSDTETDTVSDTEPDTETVTETAHAPYTYGGAA